MNRMLDLIEAWADYLDLEEPTSINDIGFITYRLRDISEFQEANILEDWKARMDQCVENEFTEPEPFEEYQPRLYGSHGQIYIQGTGQIIPIETDIYWEFDV